MYCVHNRATISIRCCLRRQEIVEEKRKHKQDLGTFSKCNGCGYGMTIKLNPNPELDEDVRRLIALYLKPIRPTLKIKKPVEVKFERPKLKIKVSEVNIPVFKRIKLKIKGPEAPIKRAINY